jgi:adenylate kinase
VYHVTNNPPKQPGVCDADGTALVQREDDKPETVRKRIEEYLKNTAPLIDYYRERHLLVEIDGTQSIEAVSEQILNAIRKVKIS